MNGAVVDVGSNTIRLLVGRARHGSVEEVCTDKVRLGLGEDVELRGTISKTKLRAATKTVRSFAEAARARGAHEVDVVVTAPGRQAANADELVGALERAAGAPVRVLTAEEEGLLAFEGAIAATGPHAGLVGVCDVGGASTELVLGLAGGTPSWIHSVDVGALRLTTRCGLGEKPEVEAVEAARAETARQFAGIVPPLPRVALAVGGSARAIRKLLDADALGPEQLGRAIELLATKSHRSLSRRHGIEPRRVRLLLAGALILAEVQRRFVLPLAVADAGLREGAILSQLDELAA